ncbi:Hyaluronidase [Aphelenchoides fujianensis]|nr:Hyaluronidase [Aphelenchoides fujianensis]
MLLAGAFLLLFWGYAEARKPFEIIWNIPSVQCKNVQPDRHGISANENRRFYGDKMVIFYETDLGLYPYCLAGPNDVKNECQINVNGGVPQAVNLSAHLVKTREDIVRAIPDENFDGFAVIDWEAWRPLYDLNWTNRRVYQRLSQSLIYERYPGLKNTSVDYLARYLFDFHAKQFFLETIRVAKETRPKARWAFWDFPLCDYTAGYNGRTECDPKYEIINEQLLWMFNASDMLLPPIYFYLEDYSTEKRQMHVKAWIEQAEMINQKLARRLPIYAYSKIEYEVEWTNQTLKEHFYTKSDLCNSLLYPSQLGVDGVFLWGTSKHMKQRCPLMADYVENTVGPFASAVIQRAEKCSKKKCNGNGKCVAIDRTPQTKCELAMQPATKCVCDEGFVGRSCKRRRRVDDSFVLSSSLEREDEDEEASGFPTPPPHPALNATADVQTETLFGVTAAPAPADVVYSTYSSN